MGENYRLKQELSALNQVKEIPLIDQDVTPLAKHSLKINENDDENTSIAIREEIIKIFFLKRRNPLKSSTHFPKIKKQIQKIVKERHDENLLEPCDMKYHEHISFLYT